MTTRTIFAASPTRTGMPGEALEGGPVMDAAGKFEMLPGQGRQPHEAGVRRLRFRRRFQLVARWSPDHLDIRIK